MTSLGAPVTVSELAPNSASLTTEEWIIAQQLNPKLQSTAQGQQQSLDQMAAAQFAHDLETGRQTLPGTPDAPPRWGVTGTTSSFGETSAASGSGPRGGVAFLAPLLTALAGPLINGAIGALGSLFSRKKAGGSGTGGSGSTAAHGAASRGAGSRPPNARGSRGPYGSGILAPEVEERIIDKLANSDAFDTADPHDLWRAVIDTAEDVIVDYIKSERDDISGGARFIAQQAMRKTLPHGFAQYIRGPRGQTKPPRTIEARDPSFVRGIPAPSAAQMAVPLMRYGARKVLGPNASRISDDLYARESQLLGVGGNGKFRDTLKRVFPKVLKFARNGLARILSDPTVKAAAADATPKLLNAAFGKFNVAQDGTMANIARSVAQKAVSGAMDAGANAARGSGRRKARGGAVVTVAPGGSLDPRSSGAGSTAAHSAASRGAGSRPPNGRGATGGRKKAAKVDFTVRQL